MRLSLARRALVIGLAYDLIILASAMACWKIIHMCKYYLQLPYSPTCTQDVRTCILCRPSQRLPLHLNLTGCQSRRFFFHRLFSKKNPWLPLVI